MGLPQARRTRRRRVARHPLLTETRATAQKTQGERWHEWHAQFKAQPQRRPVWSNYSKLGVAATTPTQPIRNIRASCAPGGASSGWTNACHRRASGAVVPANGYMGPWGCWRSCMREQAGAAARRWSRPHRVRNPTHAAIPKKRTPPKNVLGIASRTQRPSLPARHSTTRIPMCTAAVCCTLPTQSTLKKSAD